jgi:hypothetical protein
MAARETVTMVKRASATVAIEGMQISVVVEDFQKVMQVARAMACVWV